jgi:2-oxoisovalerate dehydrogenase E1 component
MSILNRAKVVDDNFIAFCRSPIHEEHIAARRDLDTPLYDGDWITGRDLYELFESQAISRHLDLMARELRRLGRGYYTIGSSGHEPNAIVGRVTRYNDPAFLHYRSGALMVERARQRPEVNMIRETLLSFMAATADPIAGGRHKVWGSVPLCVIPQTSTIASQLPRAMGAGMAITRARRLGRPIVVGDHGEIPEDAIVVCNFGDASANHASAQSALNASCYATHQNVPVPVLYVCEDNGIGISVHTPPTWIESAYSNRHGLRYFQADGANLPEAYRTAAEAVQFVRETRRPAFLHLRTVRLLGHAGTDVETEYHSLEEIAAVEAKDPLLASARTLIEFGYLMAEEVLALYEDVRARVKAELDALTDVRQIASAEEVIRPLAPFHPDAVMAEAVRTPAEADRLHAFALDYVYAFSKITDGRPRLPENQPPRHLAALLNWTLHDLMAKYPEALVFGEDVAAKGGVYHVTAGLTRRFGVGRCFNTLLDETSILGMAIGAGHLGFLPCPEIQYLAYVHNAIDQLRGEACSTQFFSQDQFRNPMVVRINSLGYQKGFGGHFHNDNSFTALRDIPGIMMAVPARGDDAAKMLRTCFALAKVDGRIVCFLEPIALYMTKDLHADGDGRWLCAYPPPDQAIPFGVGAVYRGEYVNPSFESDGRSGADARSNGDGDADDLTIITFGNGLYMSLRAARVLAEQHGIRARVVDLRWIQPLNHDLIEEQSRTTGRVLVVDEGRFSGGLSEAIMAAIAERCRGDVTVRRIVGMDTYIPLGPAANHVLPQDADVVAAAVELCGESGGRRGRGPRKVAHA